MGPRRLGSAPVWSLLLLAIIPVHATSIYGGNGLTVSVSTNGSYEIDVPETGWRFSGSMGRTLSNLHTQTGSDAVAGAYSEISFDFVSDASHHAAVRSYTGSRTVLFTVTLPNGGPNSFSFPSFTSFPKGLNHIAFAGDFAFPSFYGTSEESPGVYFDSGLNAVILSPVSHFMVASTAISSSNVMASGISTKIASLPAGFSHQTVMVLDSGINRTFESWGKVLTGLTGKTRPANDADTTLNRLGYWTDAGSTYYYSTEPGQSYPDTLSAVKADFARQGIALGYLQLDSWFYPKGGSADWVDRSGGIYEYFAADPPFASSLALFQSSIGLPLIAHARWIDPQSPYRQQYKMSGNVSIDPLYWGATARYLASSGVIGFEQDWLADMAQTDYTLTAEDEFLDNMASAMAQQNVSIQYCTGTARHFLQSARYDNLTTARVSGDRFDRTRWHDFLYASRLASAVGLWPFTDVFMSGETDNLLLATLSAGPVGVGDRVGNLNAVNLLKAVRPDGVIVKPDHPLTPIDSSFWSDSNNALLPMVAATSSDFGDLKAWYFFLYPQGSVTQAQFRLSDAGVTGPAYLYDYFGDTGRVVNPDDLLTEDVGEWRYQIAAPVGRSGMALLGDIGQFVSLGKKRVTALSDDGVVHATVAFAAGERVRTIQGYSPDAPSVEAVTGSVSSIRYHAGTGLFTVQVMPGADGTACFQISRTIVRFAAKVPALPPPVKRPR